MKRIFDEKTISIYHLQKRRFWRWCIILSIYVFSANLLLVVYRTNIGFTLSKILNVILTTLYLSILYCYLSLKLLPKRKTTKLIQYLLKNEQRQMEVTYLSYQLDKVSKYNHQFIVLNVTPANEKHQSIILLADRSFLADFKEKTNYTFYLSENILMGYMPNET